jgi:hypothetical protein
VRSFGIRSSRFPAVVDRIRDRWPLPGAAPFLGALLRRSADVLGELGLDQRLGGVS